MPQFAAKNGLCFVSLLFWPSILYLFLAEGHSSAAALDTAFLAPEAQPNPLADETDSFNTSSELPWVSLGNQDNLETQLTDVSPLQDAGGLEQKTNLTHPLRAHEDGAIEAEPLENSSKSVMDAKAHTLVPVAPHGANLCNPACIPGRGICNDKVCFCKSPYKGSICQKKNEDQFQRLSMPSLVGVALFGIVLGAILAAFTFWSMRKLWPEQLYVTPQVKRETWRPVTGKKSHSELS